MRPLVVHVPHVASSDRIVVGVGRHGLHHGLRLGGLSDRLLRLEHNIWNRLDDNVGVGSLLDFGRKQFLYISH